MINVQRQSDVLENRNHVKFLISEVSHLARQGMVFHGENESCESSNKGNFVELLEIMSDFFPELLERFRSKYGLYALAEYHILRC